MLTGYWHIDKPYGVDATDWIFLNPKIWPNLKMTRLEDLLKK